MSGLEFGSSAVELNSARTRVNVKEACATLALRARRNTQLLAQALSVIPPNGIKLRAKFNDIFSNMGKFANLPKNAQKSVEFFLKY